MRFGTVQFLQLSVGIWETFWTVDIDGRWRANGWENGDYLRWLSSCQAINWSVWGYCRFVCRQRMRRY